MELEVQEYTKEQFQTGDIREVPKSYGYLLDNVAEVLSGRMRDIDVDFLKANLIKLQEYTPLSVELVRYALLTRFESHSEAISLMYTRLGKHIVVKEISRFKRFLKKEDIKTKKIISPYKRLSRIGCDLVRFNIFRIIHQFSVK